jgi:hypothetical protein
MQKLQKNKPNMCTKWTSMAGKFNDSNRVEQSSERKQANEHSNIATSTTAPQLG